MPIYIGIFFAIRLRIGVQFETICGLSSLNPSIAILICTIIIRKFVH